MSGLQFVLIRSTRLLMANDYDSADVRIGVGRDSPMVRNHPWRAILLSRLFWKRALEQAYGQRSFKTRHHS